MSTDVRHDIEAKPKAVSHGFRVACTGKCGSYVDPKLNPLSKCRKCRRHDRVRVMHSDRKQRRASE